ncbi:MAG: hypothetical protein Harvfovirus12_23 [Harvfovirus sp.]|uniref:Cytidyltransferase-like domain-containing protein n=1 Tax=Harvfovirus sp. TaxID=2487768 RepID=A0A3G5A195_9VIRU|nr:MAG: hypothetical protein Harvfovirus12_23 [Harvfovirus sp.]
MKIGIFGGAFDPITNGHIAVCNYLLEKKIVDKVYLFPCNKSYYEKKMAPGVDRIKMCEFAVKENKNSGVEVCDYEIVNDLEGETLEILGKFLGENVVDTFYFVIGADNAMKINTWTDWEKLTAMVPFIVVPRVGSPVESEDCWYTKSPHVYLKDFEANILSSTQVRTDLRTNGQSTMITPTVAEYIKTNSLYSTPS